MQVFLQGGYNDSEIEFAPATVWAHECARLHQAAMKSCKSEKVLRLQEHLTENVAVHDSIGATVQSGANKNAVQAQEQSWETVLWAQSLAKAEKKLKTQLSLKPKAPVPDKLQHKLNESACAMFRAKKKKLKLQIQKKMMQQGRGKNKQITDDDYNQHLGLVEGGCI